MNSFNILRVSFSFLKVLRQLPVNVWAVLPKYKNMFSVLFPLCKMSHVDITLSYPRFFLKIFYLFLERGEGREKEEERSINVQLRLARTLPRTWPATQACALTGNRTSHPLVRRWAINPLSHTSQGNYLSFSFFWSYQYRRSACGFYSL